MLRRISRKVLAMKRRMRQLTLAKAAIRKEIRRKRNGPGRNQSVGGRVEKSKGFAPKSFDQVLLDAPCSALGLRRQLFAGEETIESMRKHATYQRRMLDQAVQLVCPDAP
ncbi:rRNA (cytosine-C(5))-methyltransferase NOP2C-like isoform X2 [Pyrus communis]|uniref:rRNA (cytosine-C(5))-methyltransferase NOP2C-like isoform X2 n=1 Tax=Pyrus communis TaxID=23211 RepID=UPI0035BF60DB